MKRLDPFGRTRSARAWLDCESVLALVMSMFPERIGPYDEWCLMNLRLVSRALLQTWRQLLIAHRLPAELQGFANELKGKCMGPAQMALPVLGSVDEFGVMTAAYKATRVLVQRKAWEALALLHVQLRQMPGMQAWKVPVRQVEAILPASKLSGHVHNMLKLAMEVDSPIALHIIINTGAHLCGSPVTLPVLSYYRFGFSPRCVRWLTLQLQNKTYFPWGMAPDGQITLSCENGPNWYWYSVPVQFVEELAQFCMIMSHSFDQPPGSKPDNLAEWAQRKLRRYHVLVNTTRGRCASKIPTAIYQEHGKQLLELFVSPVLHIDHHFLQVVKTWKLLIVQLEPHWPRETQHIGRLLHLLLIMRNGMGGGAMETTRAAIRDLMAVECFPIALPRAVPLGAYLLYGNAYHTSFLMALYGFANSHAIKYEAGELTHLLQFLSSKQKHEPAPFQKYLGYLPAAVGLTLLAHLGVI